MKLHESVTNPRTINRFKRLELDFINIHKGKYLYNNLVYINSKEKCLITCTTHGDFLQSIGNHLAGKGCPKCKGEKASKLKTKTTAGFIVEAKLVHGDKYDYSLVVYVNDRTKVIIICKEHGEFTQTPGNHLQDHGCPRCGVVIVSNIKFKTTEDFIKEATLKHNGKYDYSETIYLGAFEKVYIICPTHGGFWQKPSNHTQGQGCSECAIYGFKNNLPAILYYICIDEKYYKIGITNVTVKDRYRGKGQIKRIRIVKEWKYEIGQEARDVEKEIYLKFKEHLVDVNPIENTKSREIFTYDVLELDLIV